MQGAEVERWTAVHLLGHRWANGVSGYSRKEMMDILTVNRVSGYSRKEMVDILTVNEMSGFSGRKLVETLIQKGSENQRSSHCIL